MQKYCSLKCCDRARLVREQKGPIRENVPCKVCGKPFNQDRSNGSYCSKRCNWASKASGRQYKLRIPKGLIEARCEQCGVEFKHKMRSSERKARFCSFPCWYKSNSGTNNPATRDGVFHVPPAQVWRDACAYIRERDGHMCTACQAEYSGRKHPIDHIIPRRMVHGWGSDPHMIANLVTLCRACHGRKLHAENKVIKGDIVGFVLGLAAMRYPMHRVEEAFRQYGLPMQMFRGLESEGAA
jgi:5-methylcytosine-specific restriction endonuclease McrA